MFYMYRFKYLYHNVGQLVLVDLRCITAITEGKCVFFFHHIFFPVAT